MTFTRFIKRPVLSTVISIFLVILGAIGLVSLPIEQYPNIAPPTITVYTTYTGADAETVLNSVIVPLEENINGVENMTYMESSANNSGTAMITVYFKQGVNADMAAVNVQNRVSRAQGLLPAEVTRVGVFVLKRQTSQVAMYAVTSPDGRYDATFLSNYAAINIEPVIKRINGVGDVQAMGSKVYSMRIWLKPDMMKQYGLTPSDVTAALAEQNVEAAPGTFGQQTDAAFEYTIRYTGRLESETEFENIVLKSSLTGQTLKLKDVAKVELGAQDYTVEQNLNNHPMAMGMVQQVAGSNATQIAKDVKKELEKLQKQCPPGVDIKIIFDVTDFLYASIEEVIMTLFLTLVLVILVVYIFLQDFRSTLIPMIAVPVSLIGTFLFLWLFGFSINLLTLSALLLAIAIVVDDAIVVVEAVHAKLDQGYNSALVAAIDAMNEISGAIISITLVMASVFVPVSFLSGTTGTFYREFGVTMAVSIVISALNALTLSPALCAIMLKPHKEEESEKELSFVDRFHHGFNVQYEKLQKKYQKGVEKIINHRIVTGVIVVMGIVVLGVSMKTTKTGLVPDEDTGMIFVTMSMPAGTGMQGTKEMSEKINKMLMNNPAVANVAQVVGYNFIAGQGTDQGTFIVRLKEFGERSNGFLDKVSHTFSDPLRWFINPQEKNMVLGMLYKQFASLKGCQVLAFGPPMIPGFSATNATTVSMQDKTGGTVQKFYGVVQDYLKELNKRPEIQKAMTSYNPNYPQYMAKIDVAKCKQAGTSPAGVLATLQGYYGGMYASNYNSYGKLYRVYIQADPQSRKRPEDLKNIFVKTSNGMAPATEFVTLEKVYGPTTINRFNLFTSINVQVTPNDGYSSGDVMKAIEEVAEQNLPTGYGYEYSGLSRSEKESSGSTALIFVLCFVFVYLILSAQYESYLLPLAVLLSVPFGLAGAFLFTNLFGHNNDIYMQIALIMLIGLLAKNAILIVQFALERRQTGMAIKYSAILGAAARLRPILMTSLAMVIGLLPMMFASGVGKNGNQTLGAAAVGGMAIGMIVQIFIVPALFAVFQWLQEKFTPLTFDDEENAEVKAELSQYAHDVKSCLKNVEQKGESI